MSELAAKRILAGVIVLPILLSAGCTTVVRENIISSVNTGIGVSLAENPKTEMYEVKVGYIRSQFYSVPTGKMVEGATNNAANLTPELVSGIKMNSDARHLLLGITIAENFAVGKVAVMSPAAVAMYVAEAKSPASAQAAAEAVGSYASLSDPGAIEKQGILDELLAKKLKPNTTLDNKPFEESQTRDYADALAAKKGKTLKTIRRMGGKDLDELINQLKTATVE